MAWTSPALTPQEYTERVHRVTTRAPWDDPLDPDERVVIPGYASLYELSRAQERAVKAGLTGRILTWIHWTNWRVTFPVSHDHQAAVAHEIVDELSAGRLVQLLVTNWPKPELNHGVVAYAYRPAEHGVEFEVWDPNDPKTPGVLTFDLETRQFMASRLYDTEVGPIRAFRMSYSWFL